MEKESSINGILIVNKQTGMTSRDVVNAISRILGTKKVGHTGTLDPLASGVLVITVGKYTKLNEVLVSTFKEYKAKFKLGVKTDTLDIEGEVLAKEEVKFTDLEIAEAINAFKGKYVQEVPAYSAIKVNGKRLYEYARKKEKVTLPKREVEIKDIEVLSIEDEEITFKTTVSKGTYIRSLIRDIGEKLGTYAVMTGLERTRQGEFDIKDSHTIEEIESGNFEFLSIEDAIENLQIIELDENTLKRVENGVKMHLNSDAKYILFKREEKEIALYMKDEDRYKMFIKLV